MNILTFLAGFRRCDTCKRTIHKDNMKMQSGGDEVSNTWYCNGCLRKFPELDVDGLICGRTGKVYIIKR